MKRPISQGPRPDKTSYEEWMESEGIPIVHAVGGVEDVRTLERKPWARTGGKGVFIHLQGMREGGVSGMYVMEIPPGKALEPERHLYEEMLYVLKGQGATEVWQEGEGKRSFEWGEGSLFSPPLNAWHRLYNAGREPVLLLALTTAPLVIDLFHNTEFVFGAPFAFRDRYNSEEDYFRTGRKVERQKGMTVLESNFIADLRASFMGGEDKSTDRPTKVAGGHFIGFEMSENVVTGHLSEWPVGIYHKAHYHGPGAVLLGLKSQGYVLLWPKELGTTPYQNGHSDKVIKLRWGDGAVYSPGEGWFHQHFNTGKGPARHIAFRTGGAKYRVGFHRDVGTTENIKKGGTMIEYEDEDIQIRREFEVELAAVGVPCSMPAIGASHS